MVFHRQRQNLLILLAGARLSQFDYERTWAASAVQLLLERAKGQYGTALCACRAGQAPLRLQIRQRDGRSHLAVWPHEGPLHDSLCHFFHDDLSPQAVEQRAGTAGPMEADYSLPEVDHHHANARERLSLSRHEPRVIQPTLSLQAFAYKLWLGAELCRWHPKWTRDWGRTRYQLLEFARTLEVDGTPLNERLFVPRPFREVQRERLNLEWEQFALRLPRSGRLGVGTWMVIAPVKSIDTTPGGNQVARLSHMRQPLPLTRNCADFLANDKRNPVRLLLARAPAAAPSQLKPMSAQGEIRTPQVVGFFVVEANGAGKAWARSAHLLAVHPEVFIPASNHNTIMMIDALIAGGYIFERLLTLASPMDKTLPDWIVRHVLGPDGQPVARAALEILDPTISTEYRLTRMKLARKMAQQGIPTWTWFPTGPTRSRILPPLPPKQHPVGSHAAPAAQPAGVQQAHYRWEGVDDLTGEKNNDETLGKNARAIDHGVSLSGGRDA